ncbi:MAG: hypothetical protein ACI8WB_001782 [Phenylobacterium sp.]|jgi:hypothetical protein
MSLTKNGSTNLATRLRGLLAVSGLSLKGLMNPKGLMGLMLVFSFHASADLEEGIYAKHEGRYGVALTDFEPLVNLGYAPAQYELGEMYEHGLGVKKDLKKASELYHLAAKQGNAEAQFSVSTFYAQGITVEKSAKTAAMWARKSAQMGLAAAQFNVAIMYENGEGVNMDTKKAFYWYTQAAEQNYILAQYNLALMYSQGSGTKKSVFLSYVWNTIAGQNGYKDAVKSRSLDARELSVQDLKMTRYKIEELLRKIETKRTDL